MLFPPHHHTHRHGPSIATGFACVCILLCGLLPPWLLLPPRWFTPAAQTSHTSHQSHSHGQGQGQSKQGSAPHSMPAAAGALGSPSPSAPDAAAATPTNHDGASSCINEPSPNGRSTNIANSSSSGQQQRASLLVTSRSIRIRTCLVAYCLVQILVMGLLGWAQFQRTKENTSMYVLSAGGFLFAIMRVRRGCAFCCAVRCGAVLWLWLHSGCTVRCFGVGCAERHLLGWA